MSERLPSSGPQFPRRTFLIGGAATVVLSALRSDVQSAQPNLDTTFEDRFRGTRISYSRGKVTSTDFRLSNENPEPASTITDGRTERFTALGGQVMTATIFNPGQENLTVIHPGWRGDGEDALSILQVNLLVQQNPGTTVAFFNMPSMRGSEALPDSVMREMVRTGSFEAYGEQIASVIDIIRQDFERAKGVGWSLGGRAMLGVYAARSGWSGLEKVVAIDPLGSRYLGPTGIVDAFIIQEGGYANRYTPDPQTVEAKKLTAPPSPVDDEAIWQQRFGFPYAMSLEALETDLNKGMKGLGESSSATIVSPEFSGVNIPNDVANIMRRISKVTRAELIQIIVKRQSHTGIMDQHAPLFAQLITDMLKG